MLGLVLGPGWVLGVGLVVLGVSVPMPPALEPEVEAPPDVSDEVPDVDAPDVPDEVVSEDEAPPEVPDEESEGMPEPDEDEPDEDAPAGDCGCVVDGSTGLLGLLDVVPVLGAAPPALCPELSLVPDPPPVMPAHAPSNIAHAMGNIHFVIEHSRKDEKAVRTRCAP